MKNLKLFPKIFLYTLILMLLIAFFASGMIYLLAPIGTVKSYAQIQQRHL